MESENKQITPGLVFRLNDYEGPLDLLLSLIIKNKYDIKDIPINPIVDQYIEYVSGIITGIEDNEYKAEFIAMTSQLLLIKSRMFLPFDISREENDEDPRDLLAAAIEEYALVKRAAEYFGYLRERAGERFSRMNAPAEFKIQPPPDGEYNPVELENIFSILLKRVSESLPPPHDYLPTLTNRHEISVDSRIIKILRFCRKQPSIMFNDFVCLLKINDIKNLVVTFMALLELLRSGRILIDGDNLVNAKVDLVVRLPK